MSNEDVRQAHDLYKNLVELKKKDPTFKNPGNMCARFKIIDKNENVAKIIREVSDFEKHVQDIKLLERRCRSKTGT